MSRVTLTRLVVLIVSFTICGCASLNFQQMLQPDLVSAAEGKTAPATQLGATVESRPQPGDFPTASSTFSFMLSPAVVAAQNSGVMLSSKPVMVGSSARRVTNNNAVATFSEYSRNVQEAATKLLP